MSTGATTARRVEKQMPQASTSTIAPASVLHQSGVMTKAVRVEAMVRITESATFARAR